MDDKLKELTKPFSVKDIEWRVQSSGIKTDKSPWAMVLAYVTARAVQKRLDEVFGVLGWKDMYRHVDGGVICSLSCFDTERKEWVTKENGSPETKIEAFKGGISKAFVRVAASGFGVGRYLYDLDTTFVKNVSNGARYDVIRDKKGSKLGEIRWNEPGLPKWALPKGEESPPEPEAPPEETPESPLQKILDKIESFDNPEYFQSYVDKQWSSVEYALKDFPEDLKTAVKAMVDKQTILSDDVPF